MCKKRTLNNHEKGVILCNVTNIFAKHCQFAILKCSVFFMLVHPIFQCLNAIAFPVRPTVRPQSLTNALFHHPDVVLTILGGP